MKKLFIDTLISSPKINGCDDETRNHLRECRVFLVQNILPTVENEIEFSNLPRLAPPYENSWFEWTYNVQKRDDVPDDFSGLLDEHMLDLMLNSEGDTRVGVKLSTKRNDDKGWSLYFQFFMTMGNNTPLMFPIAYITSINEDGYFVEIKKYIRHGLPPVLNSLAGEMVDNDIVQQGINTVFYALGLLNCKNIITIERGGPPIGIKRNRHRKWTHRHYVLQIRTMREVTKIEHDGESINSEISFHFCRGHFKTYSAEKPLFGKFIGDFWWDAHARGSIKKGIVTKDYNINSPEND
ncbi:MAG: hypothetical protein FP831_09620 [Anaerolineae bacterium]|nr:hypothetical protein [Anaerolineae bacterium]